MSLEMIEGRQKMCHFWKLFKLLFDFLFKTLSIFVSLVVKSNILSIMGRARHGPELPHLAHPLISFLLSSPQIFSSCCFLVGAVLSGVIMFLRGHKWVLDVEVW